MRTRSTSSPAALVLALLLLPAAAHGQPDPDEETTLKRGPSDDEGTTLKRGPSDDEETTLKSGPSDDEETTFARPQPQEEPAYAPDPSSIASARLNGYAYEKAAFDVQHEGHGEDVFDFRSRLNLSLDVTRGDMVRAFISARVSHFAVGETAPDGETWNLYNSRNTKFQGEAELQEAFVFIPSDLVNLRVGNQIVRWGFGEFNKPSDVLNPSDMREGLFSDLEVPLVPVFMVHADRTFGPVNLSLVWIPFFEPNRASLFGQDWAPAAGVTGNPAFASLSGMEQMTGLVSSIAGPAIEDRIQPILLGTDPPQDSLPNGQWGGRLQWRMFDVDFGLSYFYGWDKLPWVRMNGEILNPTFFADVQKVAAFGQAHPEFLQGISTIDLDDPASLLAMAGMMGELGKDPEDKAQFEDAMAALNRILLDENGDLKSLDVASLFSTSYRRQQTVGFGWSAILFDTVGFKVDSAFSPSRTVFVESAAGFPAPVSKPAFSYSVGLDYQKSTWFDVLAEFYHFHVMDMPSGQQVFLVGNDLYMVTVASHVRFLDFEQLEVQLAAMLQLPDRGLFAFPKVSYKVTDDLRCSVGTLLVEVLPRGDDAGPAGLFDRNDSVYAEAKWSF